MGVGGEEDVVVDVSSWNQMVVPIEKDSATNVVVH
jgi:hypothetical protein